jgi:6-phosphogluconolactonase (cycloisomerase 2 family)
MYSINNSTGQLTALSPVTNGSNAQPSGITTITIGANSYAYISCISSPGYIKMFAIDNSTGQLTALSTPTISTGYSPNAISTITIGANSYLYLSSSQNGNNVYMYSIDNSTGQLTALSTPTISTGSNSFYMSTITSGAKSYVYVCNYYPDSKLSMYEINNSSGQLTALSPVTISTNVTGPNGIATITIGENSYAYVCNTYSSYISMYAINSSSGQVTTLSPGTIASVSPFHITIIRV